MRALLSVSCKKNIVYFAKKLVENGFEIISTGGTKKTLEEAGVETISIEEVTGFKEILDGRVKTLHPNIHGGLLARRDLPSHVETLETCNITPIDLVAVNLYPFKETISKENVELAEAIENIDIGGPSMLRSAAKNYHDVCVVCDPDDYQMIIEQLETNKEISQETRLALACKVFAHTACYDSIIAEYLTNQAHITDNKELPLAFEIAQPLRYGENSFQKATFYKEKYSPYSLAYSTQLAGKELSYNNIQDGAAALSLLNEFDEPCVVALKHMNPCGVGLADDIYLAWKKAYESDPVSIFGGIVACNRPVTLAMAKEMHDIFLEIIIAPAFDSDALAELTKKKNLRLITCDMSHHIPEGKQYTYVNGGLLVQDKDLINVNEEQLTFVTTERPSKEILKEMIFANAVCKHVKSNAIAIISDYKTIGVGAGQMNRVGSAMIALEQAKKWENAPYKIMASDAFFPFSDVVEVASQYGVKYIIQPGGSIRDKDSIELCNKYGIAMVFTGLRHFKH